MEKVLVRFQVQRPVSIPSRHGCDSSTPVFQTDRAGAAPAWRTYYPVWARGMEHGGGHRRTLQLPGASLHAPCPSFLSSFPPWCNQRALDLVEVAAPGQIRPGEPLQSIPTIAHKAKRPATGLQPQVTRCESGVRVQFTPL